MYPAPRYQPDHLSEPSCCRRILVVDDNFDAGSILTMLLRLKGYEVEISNSGAKAIELARSWLPSAILLDISMPEMDGYQACQLMRQEAWGRDMIVVAQTGHGNEEDIRRSFDAGFDGHLIKPVDIAELARVLARVSQSRQQTINSVHEIRTPQLDEQA